MRKMLHTPCVENSEGPSQDEARRSFCVGELVFPGLSNPTGHVMDRLKKQGRA